MAATAQNEESAPASDVVGSSLVDKLRAATGGGDAEIFTQIEGDYADLARLRAAEQERKEQAAAERRDMCQKWRDDILSGDINVAIKNFMMDVVPTMPAKHRDHLRAAAASSGAGATEVTVAQEHFATRIADFLTGNEDTEGLYNLLSFVAKDNVRLRASNDDASRRAEVHQRLEGLRGVKRRADEDDPSRGGKRRANEDGGTQLRAAERRATTDPWLQEIDGWMRDLPFAGENPRLTNQMMGFKFFQSDNGGKKGVGGGF